MQERQLEMFVAVAEERSFTKAARRFFVSQAALSQQIKALEREVGRRLLDRDNHHVELTAAGAVFLEDARDLIARYGQALERVRSCEDSPVGELSVGYIKGYEHTDLADMLFQFHARNPNVRLSFLRENVAALYDALREEKVDVVINLLYEPDKMGDIEWQTLAYYPLMATMPVSSPLAHRGSIHMEELKGYPLVDIAQGTSAYGEKDKIARTLAAAGLDPSIPYVSEDVETSLLAVAAGLGYALLPGYLTRNIPHDGKVVAVPIEGKEREMRVVAAWLPSHKNELLDVFLDEFLTVDAA